MSETITEKPEGTENETKPEGSQNGAGAPTPATETTAKRKAPDTSGISLDDINGATLAPQDLIAAAAPVRERSDQQKTMDKVATRAYAAWIEAKKPSAWNKIPVITYYLNADQVAAYKFLIRRACAIVEPVGDSTGVRVRFGAEVTLTGDLIKKLKLADANGKLRMDLEGKIVLAWAAVDKRASEDGKATGATSDAKTDGKTDTPKPGQVGRSTPNRPKKD